MPAFVEWWSLYQTTPLKSASSNSTTDQGWGQLLGIGINSIFTVELELIGIEFSCTTVELELIGIDK